MLSNTTAFDIAIGIVLVYFIYSLLVTIVGEMIVSWTGMRARTLRQGISNLLTDHHPSSDIVDFSKWLNDVFMKEPNEFKVTAAGRFYQDPTIRNLAKRGENLIYTFRNTKPSYISKETYARTLLNMFNRKGRGVTERDRVFMAIDTNALHLEPETDKRFKEMLAAANGDYVLLTTNLEDDFEQMMDRVNGWYKRKLGFVLFWIGFATCAMLNVNTFEIVKILSRNPKVRADMVKIADNAVREKNALPWADVSPDSSAYVTLLNEGYGKAIRDAKEVELLMGKGWDFPRLKETFTITDTAKIAKTRNLVIKSIKLRNKIDSIKSIIEINEFTPQNVRKQISLYHELTNQYRTHVLDSLDRVLKKKFTTASLKFDVVAIATAKMKDSSTTVILRIKDNVEQLEKEIDATVEPNFFNNIHKPRQQKRPGTTYQAIAHTSSSKKSKSNSIIFQIDQIKKAELTATFEVNFFEKCAFILCEVLTFWKPRFWGILLSALALSLGANFWFDLLKKLVSLRSAGVKPEDKKDEVAHQDSVVKTKNDGTHVQVNDSIEKLLSERRKTWENTQGVVAVNKAEIEIQGQKIEGIEIIKDFSYLAQTIPTIVHVEMQSAPASVNIHFREGSAATLNPGADDDVNNAPYIENCIIHESTKIWGTASGWVKDKDGNNAILSCGHALRSDLSGYVKENMNKVNVRKGNKNIELGIVTNLLLTNYLDISLVRTKVAIDATICKEITKVQPVVKKNSKVEINTLRKGAEIKNGHIESTSWNNRFDSKNQNYVMYNLILIYFTDQNNITAPGDSGSLVMDSESKAAIGIHIGQVTLDKKKYSLAIGIQEVFNILNLQTL